MSTPNRRLVIVVRADPVICGHSGEARNLAEVALTRGYDDVRIVTWPIECLQASGLPLKPLESVMPYSAGITVERPDPVGEYKIPDARYIAGIIGRLVELFTDGVPTVCMSLYLSPHTHAVAEAMRVARGTGLPVNVTTVAEAVGSDVTDIVRKSVASGRLGAAAHVLTTYLSQDICVAVSEYTKEVIVAAAESVDEGYGTKFAEQARERVEISYPAIDTSAFLDLDPDEVRKRVEARGLQVGEYVFYLSRLAKAKAVDDLIEGFSRSRAADGRTLVIAGRGPEADALRELAKTSGHSANIRFLDDVGDEEKPFLLAGCAAYVFPSKPMPGFVETFGIALVEKMLVGGGPVISTTTGGIGEAIGDTALEIPTESPDAIAKHLDYVLADMTEVERDAMAAKALDHAMQFDRNNVFDRLFARVDDFEAARA